MNAAAVKKHFPNASASFISANSRTPEPEYVRRPSAIGRFAEWPAAASQPVAAVPAKANPPKGSGEAAATFYVPVRTVSEANSREHWAAKAKRARLQRLAVFVHLQDNDMMIPKPPCIVTITRIGVRKLDGDNLQRAMKAVRDEVANRLGVDDGGDAVEWRYDQRKGGAKEYAVEIRIEEKK